MYSYRDMLNNRIFTTKGQQTYFVIEARKHWRKDNTALERRRQYEGWKMR